MSDKSDRFPPPSKQPVEAADSKGDGSKTLDDAKADGKRESNGSTGDQIGGQSHQSEDEAERRIKGLPK